MYKSQIIEINESLKKTRKAIISIGCSFVEGQGAVDDDLYRDYNWIYSEAGAPLKIDASLKERRKLVKTRPNIRMNLDTSLDVTMMEYENAFVSVLCKKYFQGSYTPINLGLRGCGNRASIKELYMHPNITWDIIDEIIVLYVASGIERFDFINDECIEHFNWKCMWPFYKDMGDSPRKILWEGYSKNLYSDKFAVLEQISHVQELMSWCANKKAKLIITPGFDKRYDREFFERCLASEVRGRNTDSTEITLVKPLFGSQQDKSYLLDLFPWNNMFEPDGYKTFADLALSKEDKVEDNNDHYFQFLGKGSPDRWITPCSHPSQKAHDLFAKHLYTHIINNGNL